MPPAFDFGEAFEVLTGHPPFPWQRRLFEEYFSCATLPPAVDIPTGLGKTAVMAVWLLARAAGAALPRRLVYVVDRRAVVDQATEYAVRLRKALKESERLETVRRALGLGGRSLPISTLRGRHADNRDWMADPAAPAIVVGTVDMVGSRLLFEGYGVSRRMRPYAAGLLGCDTLVMLDEAHLARPFERLLQAICKGQHASPDCAADADAGLFAGPAACNGLPPPFRVLSLSATLGGDAGIEALSLNDDDKADQTVRTRLEACKSLTVEGLEPGSSILADVLAERAWDLMQAESGAAETPPGVTVYCDRRRDAEKVATLLEAQAKTEAPAPAVILFVGARRVHEREEAATELEEHGLIGETAGTRSAAVFLVATSAGEVGVDLDADHMVCDLVAWERMVQRLGRVNRRGRGAARVLVVDQGPPDAKKKAGEAAVARHGAARGLLDALPRDEAGGRRAGPGVLTDLGSDPALRERIAAATTRTPLYPALTRPLVDAWAMTSLDAHTGRPEIGPWLRGWVEDDQPQTTVVWRQYLPLRFREHGDEVKEQAKREIRAFFEAAPPQTAELLETETARVADWLKKRARKRLAGVEKAAAPPPLPNDDGADEGDEAPAATGLLARMTRAGPIAFVLDGANRPVETLSLAVIGERSPKALHASLAGKRLVVDARFGGIADGLLTEGADGDGCAATSEDNWGKPHGDAEQDAWNLRVEALAEAGRAAAGWLAVLKVPYCVSPEDEAVSWLIVQKRRGDGESQDARAVARKAQRLDEHQRWAGKEAECIAYRLGLGEADTAMLVAAARHHDDGKAAPRWQRAFGAEREDGPYAKTTGSPNQRQLSGFRHELKSALDAEQEGLAGIDRADARFALALHLIAAHHGRARPAIGIGGYDELPPSAAEASAHAIALRFARLQRQWGPWGLAWWEALLRAADQAASKRLDEEVD